MTSSIDGAVEDVMDAVDQLITERIAMDRLSDASGPAALSYNECARNVTLYKDRLKCALTRLVDATRDAQSTQ